MAKAFHAVDAFRAVLADNQKLQRQADRQLDVARAALDYLENFLPETKWTYRSGRHYLAVNDLHRCSSGRYYRCSRSGDSRRGWIYQVSFNDNSHPRRLPWSKVESELLDSALTSTQRVELADRTTKIDDFVEDLPDLLRAAAPGHAAFRDELRTREPQLAEIGPLLLAAATALRRASDSTAIADLESPDVAGGSGGLSQLGRSLSAGHRAVRPVHPARLPTLPTRVGGTTPALGRSSVRR